LTATAIAEQIVVDPMPGVLPMTALARLLFPVPDVRRSTATLFLWWERRRPTYNLIVGGAGVITVATLQAMRWLPPHLQLDAPLPMIALYAICANVCYTFGFAFESMLQRIWGDEVAPVGPTLWRHGLVFSVGLTLFPIGIAWLGWLFIAARMYLLG
jgi:hypothetical protein